MSGRKIAGIILFIIGIYLIAMGNQGTDPCGYSGSTGQGNMIGGVILLIVGGGLFLFAPKKRKK